MTHNDKPTTTDMLTMLKRLREWEATMGGFESPVWDEARDLIDEADKAGIATNDY